MEGNGYSFDLGGTSTQPTGKKIEYGYMLDFRNPSNLPWIKITHVIPNRSYFEARIINIDAKIRTLKSENKEIKQKLQISQLELEGNKTALAILKRKFKNLKFG